MSTSTTKAEACPYQVEVVEGKKYEWCSCGMSKTKPFCDGSHDGTGCEPITFVAHRSEPVILCGCCETGNPPFCDGTHNVL
ncbi:MAG: CDGSH iron-sulfur domain-containing protein [Hyphomicrobium sp.]